MNALSNFPYGFTTDKDAERLLESDICLYQDNAGKDGSLTNSGNEKVISVEKFPRQRLSSCQSAPTVQNRHQTAISVVVPHSSSVSYEHAQPKLGNQSKQFQTVSGPVTETLVAAVLPSPTPESQTTGLVGSVNTSRDKENFDGCTNSPACLTQIPTAMKREENDSSKVTAELTTVVPNCTDELEVMSCTSKMGHRISGSRAISVVAQEAADLVSVALDDVRDPDEPCMPSSRETGHRHIDYIDDDTLERVNRIIHHDGNVSEATITCYQGQGQTDGSVLQDSSCRPEDLLLTPQNAVMILDDQLQGNDIVENVSQHSQVTIKNSELQPHSLTPTTDNNSVLYILVTTDGANGVAFDPNQYVAHSQITDVEACTPTQDINSPTDNPCVPTSVDNDKTGAQAHVSKKNDVSVRRGSKKKNAAPGNSNKEAERLRNYRKKKKMELDIQTQILESIRFQKIDHLRRTCNMNRAPDEPPSSL